MNSYRISEVLLQKNNGILKSMAYSSTLMLAELGKLRLKKEHITAMWAYENLKKNIWLARMAYLQEIFNHK